MSNKLNDLTLVGIFLCLLIIAFKPVPQMSVNQPQSPGPGETVIQLAPNRIAIVESNNNSGQYGTILVFDYDGNSFNLLGRYNYSDYFRNPQLQKPVMSSNP